MTTSNARSANLDWRKIVSLGEMLLEQVSTDEQRQLIINTAQEWFTCEARLWLSDSEKAKEMPVPGFVDKSFPKEYNRIIETHQMITGRRSILVPLLSHEALLGILQVSRTAGPAFTRKEIDFIDGFAAQSAIALQLSRQIAKERRQAELLSLVRTVSAQIADVLDLDELTKRITSLILLVFKYYYVGIFTLEFGHDTLRFRSGAGPSSNADKPIEKGHSQSSVIQVRLGEGIIGIVAQTGKEIIANDVNQDQRFRALDLLPETRSEAALPLKIENRILGVLDVQSTVVNAFDDTELLVLRVLADNIATAVENAHLYSDVRHRAEQMTSVSEVSNAITSILNEEELYKEVVRLIHRRMGYSFVHIFEVHYGRRKIFYQAGDGACFPDIKPEDLTFDLDDPQGLVPWSARYAETVVVNDVSLDSRYRESILLPEKTRSEIAVPLVFAGGVLGVLDIQSDHLNAFSEDDRALLEALADHIAIAMRNANLYRSEQWRRQVAESMREVAGLLTADIALDQVLDLILKELQQTLPCDYAAIWFLEGDSTSISEEGCLTLAAVRLSENLRTTNSEYLLEPGEILQICNDSSLSSQWLMDAVRSESPIIRTNQSPYEPLGAILDFPQSYSAIAAPLRLGPKALGVLALAHHTVGRYGSEASTMTATFASYAAVAIENTRLYEAAHDQAWISTVLLQVAEATQTLSSQEELLATMARITPMLIGVNSCVIFLWDTVVEAFIPAVGQGLSAEQEDQMKDWVIRPGELDSFDQILADKTPLPILPDSVSSDDRSFLSTFDLQNESLALFPMVSHDQVLGAFLVDYAHPDAFQAISDLSNLDWEEKASIIQGITRQTAIAVENVQLLKSQKEEAYISIALLQVAQAIVSLNNLDEILETIVRITPILVGVKRCVIYIWDNVEQVFCLAPSYGINRVELAALSETCIPQDFPILDAVRRANRLAYHVITPETESPLVWNRLSPQEFTILNHEEAEPLEKTGREELLVPGSMDYLRHNVSLLFAYPLSVKGNVLGVMLTQEPDASTGAVALHVRSRRQEITTGITQQTALAIQNDLLQKEVVERERLERELQLAREIQKTFLPDRLPNYPGWELDVRWRPAREVGGDFYDLIELPGNKIGIVIADVADKGMPAALFMTMARTLIRASVKDGLSPAAVLQQVNELLIADTKGGMFVTAVYAILSIDTGQILYANAGHNLPLRLKKTTGNLEDLPVSGMALGVLDKIQVHEYEILVDPGDILIFYTDGITEAFSTEGEMFEEGRLRDVILAVLDPSAHTLADAIDEAVDNFTQGATTSDDITLFVLRRL